MKKKTEMKSQAIVDVAAETSTLATGTLSTLVMPSPHAASASTTAASRPPPHEIVRIPRVMSLPKFKRCRSCRDARAQSSMCRR